MTRCDACHQAIGAAENPHSFGLKGLLVTHCPQGHPYDEENTRWRKDRPNSRSCITCDRASRSKSAA